MVDWEKFFSLVAASGFTGSMSIHTEYQPQDVMGALAKDLEFTPRLGQPLLARRPGDQLTAALPNDRRWR